jgi:hypothetical protein
MPKQRPISLPPLSPLSTRDEVDQAVRSGGRDQGLGFDFDAVVKVVMPAPMETTASVELALPDAVLLIVAG